MVRDGNSHQGRWGMSSKVASREPQMQQSEAQLQIELYTQGGHFLKEIGFLQVLWILLVLLTNKREANKALPLSNKSKTTYTPLVAIVADCISCGIKNRVFP